MQSSVNSSSVIRELDANLELDPPDTNASSAPHHPTRVRSVPVGHKDHVMQKSCIVDSSTVELLTSSSSF